MRMARRAGGRSRQVLGLGLAAVGAMALAACGSGGSSSSPAAAPTAKAGTVITTHAAGAAGTVFADAHGMTVYTADEEPHAKISCTGDCLKFWRPVYTTTGTSGFPGGAQATWGTVKRPDNGKAQVTLDDRPVYTFVTDTAPGMAKGDGFKDRFARGNFTWHAAKASAGGASAPSPSDSPSSGYNY